MSKKLTIFAASLVALAFCAIPVLALEPPVITLDRVEVATIQPFFIKPKIMVPSKDDPAKKEEKEMAYGYTSTMNVAYILNVKNPNKEPVMLDEVMFTVTFDGFEVNTINHYEDSWIPAGKTNQLRLIGTNEAHPTIAALTVGSEASEKIQSLKTSAGALVTKWWNEISDFSFPIEVTGGTAVFKDEKGNEMRTAFSGKYGKAKAPEAKAEPEKKPEAPAAKTEKKK
ncbi:MAG: hypothetical protein V2B18_22280 [Pseudomonadota bacterium]